MSGFFVRKRPLEDAPTAVKRLRVEAEVAGVALEVCPVVQETDDDDDEDDDELADVEETQAGDSERAPSPPLLPEMPQLLEPPERSAATPWDRATAVEGGIYFHPTKGLAGKASPVGKQKLSLKPLCIDSSCRTTTRNWGVQCKFHANPLTALILAAKPNPTLQPPWKAVAHYPNSTWKGQIDKLYHHPEYDNCLVIGTIKGGGSVTCKRICDADGCVSRTCKPSNPLCPVHDPTRCAVDGCNKSRFSGGNFCLPHSLKPGQKCSNEGCNYPKIKATGKCVNCNAKDERNANYNTPYKCLVLDTNFCAQTGSVPLPKAGFPKLADLEHGKKYAMLSDNRQSATVKVRSGVVMHPACIHPKCKQLAQRDNDNNYFFCYQHGGVKGCLAICGMDDEGKPMCPNTANYRISDQARLAQETGPSVPRPDLVGKWACLSCLTRVDPTNEAVKLTVRAEDVVMAAFNEKLLDMDRSELTPEELASTAYDCADGPSKRRADRLKKEVGYHLQLEPDEHQHADRLAGCERAKLSGHMIDAGAAHFTEDEAALWEGKPGEPKPPGDDALDKMIKAEGRDSLWARKLQDARARAVRRVQRDSRTNERNLHKEGEVVARRLVIRFNTHEFTAKCGTKVGPLVKSVSSTLKVTNKTKGHEDNKHETIVSLVPTKLMDAAITTLVEVYLDHLLKARTDPAWLAAQPDLKVIYLRYSGCDKEDGVDREGTVAATYAAAPAEMTIAQAGKDLGVKAYDPKAIYSKNKRPVPPSQAGSSRD